MYDLENGGCAGQMEAMYLWRFGHPLINVIALCSCQHEIRTRA